ncbi:MAG: tail fiber domain-containing protein [Gammaproteobacteria bacterium]|nr:tail fiber domain-containing protein [Gammaproteobacteria bacterium]MDH5618171.1 tail fiber domain-containing protein [Gammaproteobacteria bacterium]
MRKSFALLLLLPLAALAEVVVPADKVEDSVNIRLEPDASSDVVGELHKGTSLPHVRSIDGWHEVELEGEATGYISADWSRVEPNPPEAEAEEVDADGAEAEAAEEFVEEAAEAVVEDRAEPAVATERVTAVEPEPEPELEPEPEPPPPAAVQDASRVDRDVLAKGHRSGELGNSQIFDDGNRVGIGTREPQQRLEVNGSIQINDQNSNVAGLIITQGSGDTGYIMHNRASTLTLGAGSVDRITIDRDGNVGFAVARPEHPLEMASGAHVTAGGVWTNRSSRDSKEAIAALLADEALVAVMQLEPVSFRYKAEQGERYLGFIAEDVPSLLASHDRKSLSTMDIVAALTRVVQEQQRRIEALEDELDARSKH